MWCEFGGGKNDDEFWEKVREGKERIRFLSKKELQGFGI
ncbi:beta-ketoacyl synthase N-terminal-like domain-containing protein [Bacillus subtilis]|nr:beta-ketoacyl synthase N-terminal-like domain-containing protein [Bacillus subtilis]